MQPFEDSWCFNVKITARHACNQPQQLNHVPECDRAQSDRFGLLPAPSNCTSATASAAPLGEGDASSLAPPEASASPTFRAAREEPAASPTHGTAGALCAEADATEEPNTNEARLAAELIAARQEIAALRVAAEVRGSGVGVARRSDLLVLQELETAEMRDRLMEADGWADIPCNPRLLSTHCDVRCTQFSHPISMCYAV